MVNFAREEAFLHHSLQHTGTHDQVFYIMRPDAEAHHTTQDGLAGLSNNFQRSSSNRSLVKGALTRHAGRVQNS